MVAQDNCADVSDDQSDLAEERVVIEIVYRRVSSFIVHFDVVLHVFQFKFDLQGDAHLGSIGLVRVGSLVQAGHGVAHTVADVHTIHLFEKLVGHCIGLLIAFTTGYVLLVEFVADSFVLADD